MQLSWSGKILLHSFCIYFPISSLILYFLINKNLIFEKIIGKKNHFKNTYRILTRSLRFDFQIFVCMISIIFFLISFSWEALAQHVALTYLEVFCKSNAEHSKNKSISSLGLNEGLNKRVPFFYHRASLISGNV